MFSASDNFARVTRLHDKIAREISPCANFLHHWLLRLKAPGTVIEFEFADFQAEQTYSDKWIRHALNELVEHDLVQVVRKFGAGVYRLIAFHPKEENQMIGTTVPETSQSTSEKQPSNADSLALLYRYIENRYIEKTTNKPTHHPVSSDEQERIKISPPILKSDRSQTPKNQPNPEPEPPTTIPPESPQPEISPEISEKLNHSALKVQRLQRGLKAPSTSSVASITTD